MMQCPVCKTLYTDTTLRYCLADGSALIDTGDDQPTVVRPGTASTAEETVVMSPRGAQQMRVDIPQERTTAAPLPPSYAPVSNGSSRILKILLIVVGLVIFAVLAIAAGGFIYFNRTSISPSSTTDNRNTRITPSPVASPAGSETDKLRDQIANLEKQLDQQKKNSRKADVPLALPEQSSTTTPARVNSPGDGFLALRALPNSELGDRIAKIPHGATVSVGACGPVVKPVNRTGRWCQASYNGLSGWVFDAYLIY